MKFPENTCFKLNMQQAFEIEILVKQTRIIPNAQHFISIKMNYKFTSFKQFFLKFYQRIDQNPIEDVLNITFKNSWFVDFLQISPRDIPSLMKKFNKDVVLDKKFLLQKEKKVVERYLDKTENLIQYEKMYIAMFKDLFFGDYVDFLLLLRIEDTYLYLTIKMGKKNIKIEMNYEELHMEFDYLISEIQEYFKEII